MTTSCLGSGYLLYKLYNAHTRKLADLEQELANERENDEIIKTQFSFCNLSPKAIVFFLLLNNFCCFLISSAYSCFWFCSLCINRMKAHFENIQMIADTTTLPHAMHHLSSRLVEEIDVSSIMEKLSKGKGILIPSEKLQLWNELKILSALFPYLFSLVVYNYGSLDLLINQFSLMCFVDGQVSRGWFCPFGQSLCLVCTLGFKSIFWADIYILTLLEVLGAPIYL